jgi:hypothetical protein
VEFGTIDPAEKLDNISAMISRYWEAFWQRPGLLGSPRDVEAMLFYMDQFEFLLRGGHIDAYRDVCWAQFLIEKKLIRGGGNLFREALSDDLDDFQKLQALRREFLAWREAREAWSACQPR